VHQPNLPILSPSRCRALLGRVIKNREAISADALQLSVDTGVMFLGSQRSTRALPPPPHTHKKSFYGMPATVDGDGEIAVFVFFHPEYDTLTTSKVFLDMKNTILFFLCKIPWVS